MSQPALSEEDISNLPAVSIVVSNNSVTGFPSKPSRNEAYSKQYTHKVVVLPVSVKPNKMRLAVTMHASGYSLASIWRTLAPLGDTVEELNQELTEGDTRSLREDWRVYSADRLKERHPSLVSPVPDESCLFVICSDPYQWSLEAYGTAHLSMPKPFVAIVSRGDPEKERPYVLSWTSNQVQEDAQEALDQLSELSPLESDKIRESTKTPLGTLIDRLGCKSAMSRSLQLVKHIDQSKDADEDTTIQCWTEHWSQMSSHLMNYLGVLESDIELLQVQEDPKSVASDFEGFSKACLG